MFISRHVYDEQRVDLLTAQAEHRAVLSQNAQLNAHIEWLQVRLTQVEYERAGLIKRYMGIDVPVATFEPNTDKAPDPNQTMDFNDIGDAEAARLGLEWAADGTVVQSPKK